MDMNKTFSSTTEANNCNNPNITFSLVALDSTTTNASTSLLNESVNPDKQANIKSDLDFLGSDIATASPTTSNLQSRNHDFIIWSPSDTNQTFNKASNESQLNGTCDDIISAFEAINLTDNNDTFLSCTDELDKTTADLVPADFLDDDRGNFYIDSHHVSINGETAAEKSILITQTVDEEVVKKCLMPEKYKDETWSATVEQLVDSMDLKEVKNNLQYVVSGLSEAEKNTKDVKEVEAVCKYSVTDNTLTEVELVIPEVYAQQNPSFESVEQLVTSLDPKEIAEDAIKTSQSEVVAEENYNETFDKPVAALKTKEVEERCNTLTEVALEILQVVAQEKPSCESVEQPVASPNPQKIAEDDIKTSQLKANTSLQNVIAEETSKEAFYEPVAALKTKEVEAMCKHSKTDNTLTEVELVIPEVDAQQNPSFESIEQLVTSLDPKEFVEQPVNSLDPEEVAGNDIKTSPAKSNSSLQNVVSELPEVVAEENYNETFDKPVAALKTKEVEERCNTLTEVALEILQVVAQEKPSCESVEQPVASPNPQKIAEDDIKTSQLKANTSLQNVIAEESSKETFDEPVAALKTKEACNEHIIDKTLPEVTLEVSQVVAQEKLSFESVEQPVISLDPQESVADDDIKFSLAKSNGSIKNVISELSEVVAEENSYETFEKPVGALKAEEMCNNQITDKPLLEVEFEVNQMDAQEKTSFESVEQPVSSLDPEEVAGNDIKTSPAKSNSSSQNVVSELPEVVVEENGSDTFKKPVAALNPKEVYNTHITDNALPEVAIETHQVVAQKTPSFQSVQQPVTSEDQQEVAEHLVVTENHSPNKSNTTNDVPQLAEGTSNFNRSGEEPLEKPESLNDSWSDASLLNYSTFVEASDSVVEAKMPRFQKQSDLKLEICSLQQENAKLRLELIQNEEILIRSRAAISQDISGSDLVEQMTAHFQTSFCTLRKENSELRCKLKEAEKKEKDLDKMNHENLALQGILKDFEKMMNLFADKEDASKQQLARLKSECDKFKLDNDSIKCKFIEMFKEYEQSVAQTKTLKAQVEHYKNEIVKLETALEEFNKKCDHVKSEALKSVDRANKENIKLTLEREQLLKKVKSQKK